MIRTVVMPDTNQWLLSLPDEYVGKEVEIIAFPINEANDQMTGAKGKINFSALKLDTTGFTFNREQANER